MTKIKLTIPVFAWVIHKVLNIVRCLSNRWVGEIDSRPIILFKMYADYRFVDARSPSITL